MKKNIVTLFALSSLAIVSCVKAPSVEQPEISNNEIALFNNINPVSTLQVPAVAGKITVVTFNGNVICLTKTATSIPIPRTGGATKAETEAIQISYVDESDPKYVDALGDNEQTSTLWQTLAFEDSMVGDYDYNDLVIHLCQQKNISKKGNDKGEEWFHIGLHPIAYGATKKFELGCDVYYNDQKVIDNYIVAENARSLFTENNGKETAETEMLNTSSINYRSNFFTKILSMDATDINLADIKVIWFIRVDFNSNGSGGRKLYAVNNKYPFADKAMRPYGILITDNGKTTDDFPGAQENKLDHCSSWFEYPRESQNISKCYPSFDGWLLGTAKLDLHSADASKGLIFDVTEKGKGHFVYQIENGNEKDLGGNQYDKERVTISTK